jgi:Transcription factor S-II (TFIIS)
MTNIAARTVQCPNEKCESIRAFFYQLQIRSADEPMTSFFKVGSSKRTVHTLIRVVHQMRAKMERIMETDFFFPLKRRHGCR